MTIIRTIAAAAGAVTAIAAFCVSMWLLIFGGLFPNEERLVFVSIALGPVAVVAVMAGFAVWWFVMFFLTLVGFGEKPAAGRRDPRDGCGGCTGGDHPEQSS
ncbi:MAG: hypothetical protein V1792_00165 [Pseudomonadota bacterium]